MIISISPSYSKFSNLAFRISAKLRGGLNKYFKYPILKTPVIINNFNRLGYLKGTVEYLEKHNINNIYIIDNNSTYPPLLEYYKKCPYSVFKINKNVGHMAFWKTHIHLFFKNQRYVYTDPDLLPIKECPKDFLQHFEQLLNKYSEVDKVGFGLKIDDIPDYFPDKDKVIKWESKFWDNEIEPGVYKAPIDTTFALYRENSFGDPAMMKALRTGDNYICKHLPWYIDPDDIDPEEQYYIDHASSVSSWIEQLKGKSNKY